LGTVLRPLAILVGFCFGIALCIVYVSFINDAFLPSFRGSQGFADWGLTGLLAYIAMYLVLIYIGMNTVFKMPDTLAYALIRWLGANAGGEKDEASGMHPMLSGLSGRLGSVLQRKESGRSP
jgi:hypothetical protein